MTERKAQEIQLFAVGGEQEIRLIAIGVRGAVQFRARRALEALDVVTGGQTIRIQVLRGFQQIAELDPFVAADAGNRCGTGEILIGKLLDHRVAEPILVVEDVMREIHFLGDAAGIMDVRSGATRALLRQRLSVIVKLKRDPDDVVAFTL